MLVIPSDELILSRDSATVGSVCNKNSVVHLQDVTNEDNDCSLHQKLPLSTTLTAKKRTSTPTSCFNSVTTATVSTSSTFLTSTVSASGQEAASVINSIYESYGSIRKDPVSRSSPSSGFSSGSFDTYYGVVINGSDDSKCAGSECDFLRHSAKRLSNSNDSGRKSLSSLANSDSTSDCVQIREGIEHKSQRSSKFGNSNESFDNTAASKQLSKYLECSESDILNASGIKLPCEKSGGDLTLSKVCDANNENCAEEYLANELLSSEEKIISKDDQISKAVRSTFQYIRSKRYLPTSDAAQDDIFSRETVDDYSYCDISGTESAIFDAVLGESDSTQNRARLNNLRKNYARLLARENAKKLSGYSIGVNGRHILKPLTESNGDCDENVDDENNLDHNHLTQLAAESYDTQYTHTFCTDLAGHYPPTNLHIYKRIEIRNQSESVHSPENLSSNRGEYTNFIKITFI